MTIDINALALVLAQAAEAEIRPRFRALGKGDIRTKADANDRGQQRRCQANKERVARPVHHTRERVAPRVIRAEQKARVATL